MGIFENQRQFIISQIKEVGNVDSHRRSITLPVDIAEEIIMFLSVCINDVEMYPMNVNHEVEP